MSREDRIAKWNEYMETQFLACLLAMGPEPVQEEGEMSWLFWERRSKYYKDCMHWLYPRMNYTPCKKASSERHQRGVREAKLYSLYRNWYRHTAKGVPT